ncbi:thiosulfate reductase / polysulfide reductase chain A [Thermoflexales bacterium]|nr:thiosulfate reductase / polysulfide reductase chain A [Thermoflexales bacterium]
MTEIVQLSRRNFLKLSGATLAAAGLASMGVKVAWAQENGLTYDTIVPTLCEQCVWRCGVLAKVKDGKIHKLDGNPANAHSNGKLCARGQSGIMTTYDPDRITTPLIRVGARGEGKFRRASWDEALDLVAQNMLDIKQKYGAEAMIFSSTHNLSQPLFENLLYGFGSPNYGTQRSLCFNAMVVAHLMTYGLEEPGRDYTNVKYIIYTGRNMAEAISTSETASLMDSLAKGVHVVVLDPRFTKTASKATEWLPIKPGTDLAFHLALINVIMTNQLYNVEFVEKNTIGFEELAQAIGPYTPEWAAPLTGIDAATIDRIAREFATAGREAMAHPGWRTSNFVNSFQAERAIAILNALVGNWGNTLIAAGGEGGGIPLGKPTQPPYPRITAQRLDGVPWKYPLVPLKIGVFQEIRDNVLTGRPYQAHGWFIARQNPIDSLPDRAKTIEAFSKLDFIVTVSILPNDTEWYADVILPESSYLERYDPLLVLGNKAFLRQPVVEPIGDTHSALWIHKHLGERLGLADYFQYTDEVNYINQQLAPLGLTVDDIRLKGYYEAPHQPSEVAAEPEYKFNTPTGKIEIASETLRKAGQPAVPAWQEPPEPASGKFYLLTGKVGQHTQFATQNNQWLHQLHPDNPLWIHPQAAAERGLADGDIVTVRSDVGEVQTAVSVTEGIRPDCVWMTQGFGKLSLGLKTAYGLGASDSDLHVTVTDPVSGGQALSQTFVTVEKA